MTFSMVFAIFNTIVAVMAIPFASNIVLENPLIGFAMLGFGGMTVALAVLCWINYARTLALKVEVDL